MMTFSKIISTTAVAAVLSCALAGCQKQETTAEKGPAEQAGQKLDQAASQAATEINKATLAAGKGLEKAGEKIQDAAKDAQKP